MQASNTEADRRYAAEIEKRKTELRIEQARKQAVALGGIRALNDFTVDKFTPGKITKDAFEAAKKFNYKKDNLYLFGPTGTGKSHLAAIAARQWIENAHYIATVGQQEISRMVRKAQSADEEWGIIISYISKQVLVIEDLGVTKSTEFSTGLLFEIINSRYQDNQTGLIITSNLGLDDLATKLGDDRISSRLAQMCKIFSFAGERDHRV